jgi:hypothetical protein
MPTGALLPPAHKYGFAASSASPSVSQHGQPHETCCRDLAVAWAVAVYCRLSSYCPGAWSRHAFMLWQCVLRLYTCRAAAGAGARVRGPAGCGGHICIVGGDGKVLVGHVLRVLEAAVNQGSRFSVPCVSWLQGTNKGPLCTRLAHSLAFRNLTWPWRPAAAAGAGWTRPPLQRTATAAAASTCLPSAWRGQHTAVSSTLDHTLPVDHTRPMDRTRARPRA